MVEGGSRVHEANGGNDLIHTRSGQSIVRPTLERGKEQAASVIHGPHKSRKHEIVIHGEVVKTADGKSVVRWLRVLPGKTIVKDYIDTQLIKKKKKEEKKALKFDARNECCGRNEGCPKKIRTTKVEGANGCEERKAPNGQQPEGVSSHVKEQQRAKKRTDANP